jgi:branched-chain amino acid aminotransferase
MNIVWHNGAVLEETVSVSAFDRGLNLGDGVFETIAVHANKAIWLQDHVERLRLAALELGIGFNDIILDRAIANVLRKNSAPSAVLRITLSRGVVAPRALTGDGQSPTLVLTLSAYDASKPNSISLATSNIRRNETSPASRLKTLSYIDNIMAAREVTHMADDALMLNTKGDVACTTIGNIFLLKGNRLITPKADQGILCGITRSKLLPVATEAVVSPADVFEADAVFRTNSLRLITPVTSLDGKALKTAPLKQFEQILKEGS